MKRSLTPDRGKGKERCQTPGIVSITRHRFANKLGNAKKLQGSQTSQCVSQRDLTPSMNQADEISVQKRIELIKDKIKILNWRLCHSQGERGEVRVDVNAEGAEIPRSARRGVR